VTGIEPALSAWELDCHASLTIAQQVTQHLRLSVGTPQVPLMTLPTGTQRARDERLTHTAVPAAAYLSQDSAGVAATRMVGVDEKLTAIVPHRFFTAVEEPAMLVGK
jgi:hypothetical protein